MNALEKFAAKRTLTNLLMEKIAIVGGLRFAARAGRGLMRPSAARSGAAVGSALRNMQAAKRLQSAGRLSPRISSSVKGGLAGAGAAGASLAAHNTIGAGAKSNLGAGAARGAARGAGRAAAGGGAPMPSNPQQAQSWTNAAERNAQRMGHGARRDFVRQQTVPVTQSTMR